MSEKFTSARVQLAVMVVLATAVLAPSRAASQSANTIADSFDNAASGRSTANWAPISGAEREWAVLPHLAAPTPPNILANIWVGAENGGRSILIRTDYSLANGTLSVRLKPMGGLDRQAAGVVWGFRGADKHWFARLDFAESTAAICVVDGGTTDCDERKADLDAMSWSTVTVKFLGRRVSLALEGQPLLEIEGQVEVWPGKTGLWSASSSVTFFDDFKATEGESK